MNKKDKFNLKLNDNENIYYPFINFSKKILEQSRIREEITSYWTKPETELVPWLIEQINFSQEIDKNVTILTKKLILSLRKKNIFKFNDSLIQTLLQEFPLSSQEGKSLMCLAEALLRIPDEKTQYLLIKDKIESCDWFSHININIMKKPLLLKTSIIGVLLISSLIKKTNKYNNFHKYKNCFNKKFIQPIITKIVKFIVRFIGKQFVTGDDIKTALIRSLKFKKQGFCYSYDMLGEAALNDEDAQRYFLSYESAIHEIGKNSKGLGIYKGSGISIKLSALHPRYCRSQYTRVMNELYPRLYKLLCLAKKYDIGINIDAEESDRLEISLDILKKICFEPVFNKWNGIGFVVQAYQKRCMKVIEEIIDIAKNSNHRLMIRLVKGAYWDSEIKKAQLDGMVDYPVFTRKIYTDISYLASACRLLSAPKYIYPQFATHNAYTVSAIYYLAGGNNYYQGKYEFQCLHGMGEKLYKQIVNNFNDTKINIPCRIYAPVGHYKTLLSYLVRRLLENGANTSFINQVANNSLLLNNLILNPINEIHRFSKKEGCIGLSNPKIVLPKNIYGKNRINSIGMNLSNEQNLLSLSTSLINDKNKFLIAEPIIANREKLNNNEYYKIINPADNRDIIGECYNANLNDVLHAIDIANLNKENWFSISYNNKAIILNKIADNIELEMKSLIGLLIRESGKNFHNAINEIREAIDFLRYYACQVSLHFKNSKHTPLGVIVCISPWNFPIAIFVGQIAAALASGNVVLAKPAEQTPLIAYKIIQLMLKSGIPKETIQLLPGKGEIIGTALISNPDVSGVIFTGSTEVAKKIQKIISQRLNIHEQPITFIAETGGINAMIVDSSALVEQVVIDVIYSAFDSAGQRCSSLRLLCIQDEIYEFILQMLKKTIVEYKVGNPSDLENDIGPVIDYNSKKNINSYIDEMNKLGFTVWQDNKYENKDFQYGNFILPTIIEINDIKQVKKEVFGPVLHVFRYKSNELDNVIKDINLNGYGLTMGIHTRIDNTFQKIIEKYNIGNYYINRNMIGAVVGVQPFGGFKLSGTGPKAGGPLYLYRLLSHRKNLKLPIIDKIELNNSLNYKFQNSIKKHFIELIKWIDIQYPEYSEYCRYINKISQSGSMRTLNGITGEQNNYYLLPHKNILCLADNHIDLLIQLIVVINIGSKIIYVDNIYTKKLLNSLPKLIQLRVKIISDWINNKTITFDSILFHGDKNELIKILKIVSNISGPIISVHSYKTGDKNIMIERLLREYSVSINTTAAGGNTTLISIE